MSVFDAIGIVASTVSFRPGLERPEGRKSASGAKFRRIFSFLGAGEQLYELLERQVEIVQEGAVAFSRATTGTTSFEAQAAVDRLGVEGDDLAREIEQKLRATLFSPIDREDLHRLSSEMHEVLALASRSAHDAMTFSVEEPVPAMQKLASIIVRSTETIGAAIRKLRDQAYAEVPALSRELQGYHRDGLELHDEALSSLLRQDDDQVGHILVRKAFVLQNVKNTLRQFGSLAKLLTRLAVKNS